MQTYKVKIGCGNCFAEREYVIERETPVLDAILICPNCGCCPVESDFKIFTKQQFYGKAKNVEDKE